MPAASLRFHPPPLVLTPELRWVLLRAFGKERQATEAGNARKAVDLAVVFDLAARIVVRVPAGRLMRELGRRPTALLLAAHARTAARTRPLLAMIPELASVAAATDVPLVFLKFAALHLAGLLLPESRPAGDIDLLVPSDRRDRLSAALIERGFRRLDVPDSDHHPSPLLDPQGRIADVHDRVPGVHATGETRPATFEALEDAGALRPIGDLPGECSIPATDVLLAHAIAHGIAQHGFAPRSYNLMRMIADLVDLSLGRDDGSLAASAGRWVGASVTPDELAATTSLCRRLEHGDICQLDAMPADTGEIILLRHIVAGVLDRRYRESLRLPRVFAGVPGRGRVGVLAARAWGALHLTDEQIDAIYGRPESRAGYVWRRLTRPFDLVLRLMRSALAARRL